jgi:hypothetical protein
MEGASVCLPSGAKSGVLSATSVGASGEWLIWQIGQLASWEATWWCQSDPVVVATTSSGISSSAMVASENRIGPRLRIRQKNG